MGEGLQLFFSTIAYLPGERPAMEGGGLQYNTGTNVRGANATALVSASALDA